MRIKKLNVFNLQVIKGTNMDDSNFGAPAPLVEKKSTICGIKKKIKPVQGAGVFDTIAGTALDGFVHHALPYMAKKTIEMGRYYGSEALRNPKLQKKAIDYALDKLNPMIQNVGSQALNQLSTKIRPKKNYKTNRKDLDGGALARRKPTLTDKIAEAAAMFVNPTASWPAVFMKLGSQGLKGITDNIQHYRGGAVDIHKQIGKLPRPAKGWTLPGHKYTGPYNDLEK